MKIERKKNAIRNAAWGYVNKLANIILPFIFRTVMIKCLGSDYLGISSLFTSILQVLNLSELGFGTAIVYSMYKPIAENDKSEINALLNYYRKVYIAIGSIILFAGTLMLPFLKYLISGGYPSDINIYFVYYMFLLNTSVSYFLFGYKGSILNAFQRNDYEYKANLVIAFFRYTIEIVGIYLTRKYYLFLVIELLSTVLNNVLKLYYTKKYFPQYKCSGQTDCTERSKIRSNVTAIMFHKIGSTILNSADNIVLSAFMGVVVVSNYGNYYYIMNAIQSIILTLFTGMTAGIGNSFLVEKVSKNRDNFLKVLFLNAWIVGVCSISLMCICQPFIAVWLGNEFLFDTSIVVLMVIYFYVHMIRRTIIVFRDAAGMWRDNKWQPIVSAIFNLLVNIMLVQIIGVYGVILSSVLSMTIIDIPWEAKKFCKRIELDEKIYMRILLKYSIVALLTGFITYIVCEVLPYDGILEIILRILICTVIPNMIFFVLYRKTDEFKYYLNFL